jgi:Prolyl oligopeptidase family
LGATGKAAKHQQLQRLYHPRLLLRIADVICSLKKLAVAPWQDLPILHGIPQDALIILLMRMRRPSSTSKVGETILRQEGKVVDAHYYTDEGHGFARRENQIDAMERSVAWFDRYLKGKQ